MCAREGEEGKPSLLPREPIALLFSISFPHQTPATQTRAVKGIFVNRELLVLFPVNCEITFLLLVKRDFGNRGEP